MRELWPAKTTIDSLYPNSKDFSELVNTLAETVNTLINRVESNEMTFEEFKSSLTESVNTIKLDAEQANIDSAAIIDATITNILATDIDTSNLKAETANIVQAAITTLTSANGTITNLSSSVASIDDLKSSTIEADIVKANTFEVDNYSVENATITTLDADSIDANTIAAENLGVDEAVADKISANSIESDTIKSNNADLQIIANNTIETEYIVHNTEYTTITNEDHIIVEIPSFVNGSYRFALFQNDTEHFFTSEIFNGANNFFVRFNNSKTEAELPLRTVGFYNISNDVVQVYFDINTFGKALRLYYIADTFNTKQPPIIHSSWPIDTSSENFREYDTVAYKQAGNLFNRPIIFDNEAATSGTLLITETDVYEDSSTNQIAYDTSDNVDLTIYRPDQSLNTTDDVVHKSLETTDRLVANKKFFVGSLVEYKNLEDTPVVAII